MHHIMQRNVTEAVLPGGDLSGFTAPATLTHCEMDTLPGLFTQGCPGLAVGEL